MSRSTLPLCCVYHAVDNICNVSIVTNTSTITSIIVCAIDLHMVIESICSSRSFTYKMKMRVIELLHAVVA